ncbi:hypothetical protein ARHIZOSPH14_03030 [Agromyces rhizosphaerae]|uniref:DUF4350 domain-containing protein n=1 Tax=Agromyces rhizosphaerae TaxID=88374 RepID=A0A9W6CU16_9MICO|nr:DUF4350 domain-containing protein [Agromyces rhizosphaerae]GLI26061.1 hypothetical protein ARHIZOSPH14_03030 [Agromyces rhizosphaerae]
MSAPAPASDVAPAETPTVRRALADRRGWIVVGALVLVAAIGVAVLQGAGAGTGRPLAVDGAAPAGGAAVASVLAEQGVQVTPADSLAAALPRAAGATVLLVDDLGLLEPARVAELADAADRLVVVAPTFAALEALAPGVRFGGVSAGPTDAPGCDLRAAVRAGALGGTGAVLTLDDEATDAGWRGCFPDETGAVRVAVGPGGDDPDVVLVAGTEVLANDTVTDAGNAALALGLLGAGDRLVWYQPGPGDVDGARPGIAELTPPWVSPVLLLLVATTVAAGVWRGRRFGPLVVERLPVVVRARETTEGRGRLYARSAARGRALDAMRIGALGRTAARVGLAGHAPAGDIADAAAALLGIDPARVRALLIGEPPADDAEFTRLARELDDLEERVAAAVRAPGASDDPTARPRNR